MKIIKGEFILISDLAEMLSISESTVYKLARSKKWDSPMPKCYWWKEVQWEVAARLNKDPKSFPRKHFEDFKGENNG